MTSPIANRGITLRPLCPVHPSAVWEGSDLRLGWTRRARGAWAWADGVDAPLVEQAELYEVLCGPPEAPLARWETSEPSLLIPAATVTELAAVLPGAPLSVRQVGTFARSLPLLLTTLP